MPTKVNNQKIREKARQFVIKVTKRTAAIKCTSTRVEIWILWSRVEKLESTRCFKSGVYREKSPVNIQASPVEVGCIQRVVALTALQLITCRLLDLKCFGAFKNIILCDETRCASSDFQKNCFFVTFFRALLTVSARNITNLLGVCVCVKLSNFVEKCNKFEWDSVSG